MILDVSWNKPLRRSPFIGNAYIDMARSLTDIASDLDCIMLSHPVFVGAYSCSLNS